MMRSIHSIRGRSEVFRDKFIVFMQIPYIFVRVVVSVCRYKEHGILHQIQPASAAELPEGVHFAGLFVKVD